MIIPSTSFGLKESLIERAGEIVEKPSSTPFITETTGGKLNCQRILFVNWSLPTTVTNDDELSESIRFFIFESMRYVTTVQSVAFAMPDLCKQEEIFAEEMIEGMIEQIDSMKSSKLKVSFVLSPDQQSLHQRLTHTIDRVHDGKDSLRIFYCPTSSKIERSLIQLFPFYSSCNNQFGIVR